MMLHVFIRGNHREDIFFDKVDFINAWNRVWISAYETGVQVFALELLSNHLHCGIMYEDSAPGKVSEFIHFLRMSLSAYFNRRYHVSGSLGSRRYGRGKVCDPTRDHGNDLRDLICYIHRNVTHHGVTDDYAGWLYSTYKLPFGLAEPACYLIANLPAGKWRAYFPNRVLPPTWGVAKNGMLLPPDSLYPRAMVESFFQSRELYEDACSMPTRREYEGERNERKLGHDVVPSPHDVSDMELIDFVRENARISVVEMDQKMKKTAIIATFEQYPKATLRQLSRIFGVPFSTIKYWLAHR